MDINMKIGSTNLVLTCIECDDAWLPTIKPFTFFCVIETKLSVTCGLMKRERLLESCLDGSGTQTSSDKVLISPSTVLVWVNKLLQIKSQISMKIESVPPIPTFLYPLFFFSHWTRVRASLSKWKTETTSWLTISSKFSSFFLFLWGSCDENGKWMSDKSLEAKLRHMLWVMFQILLNFSTAHRVASIVLLGIALQLPPSVISPEVICHMMDDDESDEGAMSPATKRSGDKSVVQLYGLSASSCGYCKETSFSSSVSYGAVSKVMMAEDYETLMLIGWRRSGKIFFEPCYFYATMDMEGWRYVWIVKLESLLNWYKPPLSSDIDSIFPFNCC